MRRKAQKHPPGFTLIELLVTIGIIGIITGSLILYNRTAEQQILLAKSTMEVLSVLSRAKGSAVAGLADPDRRICGYGVYFSEPRTMIFFRDVIKPCDQEYTKPGGNAAECGNADAECIEEIILSDKVKFSYLELSNIIFVPPNPDVFIDGGERQSATIHLSTIIGDAKSKIKVTDAGQITVTQ